ncbi:hypothetical protein Acr_00g0050460 [Actinidia rufa]|uniref:Serine/threonine-protein phosphatase 7 long form-like protein n=1 Tax=Actinidia rufa TaxID=165716 RepID=A0A7J0DKT6_9ERIC|nr:hypothetical protein Acr_00g0050460 [Actinidia rufa]
MKFKDLIWQAGIAYQVRKFDEVMEEIKNLGTKSESVARVYRALCNEDPTKWTLAHDGGYRWGVTTTNDSECYNNVLRGARDLPITSCVEVTFYRLGLDALTCRGGGSGLYVGELDPRVLQYVLRAGFNGVHRLGLIRLDHALITAFGIIPPAEEIDNGRLRKSWLRHTFDILPEHADDVSVQRHAHAYILRLIGGAYSWGSAVLAMLYRSMCRVAKISQRQIAGALLLLHVIPAASNTSPTLHGIDMRGRARIDWTQFYREHIDRWHHRPEYLVVGVIDAAAMRYDDPYMVWYRRITRTLVGNPVHRPTSGYVEIGSTIEIETRYIAAIHDRIDRAIYAYYRPESLQDMYTTYDMCSSSLHALREHQRIGRLGVPEPPSTIPLGVPATSHVTPKMPSYTYHISSHNVPSSSRPSSSGIRPHRTTHRHITSPVTYDQCSSFSLVGDEEEFSGYVDQLLASKGK